jgi:hypothetical protein
MCKQNLQFSLGHGCNLVLFSIIITNICVSRQENIRIDIYEMCQINAYLGYLFAQSNDVNIWLTSSEV